MQKNTFGLWTDWTKFQELYEYHGLINEDLKSNRGSKIKWNGKEGKPLQDNGFRLRSKNYGNGSYKSLPLKISEKEKKCTLKENDVGVYCLKVISEKRTFHYVGVSHKPTNGIHGRLLHHFIKIAGTCEHAGPRYNTDSSQFKKMRDYLKKSGVNSSLPDFFESSVYISFIKFPSDDSLFTKVMKIEGMAMQAFRHYFNTTPELNSRDETYGIENFPFEK